VTDTTTQGQDVARTAWAGITLRIAEAVLRERIKLSEELLRDLRDHVLYHTPRHEDPWRAEERGEWLAEDFVRRLRRLPLRDRTGPEFTQPLSHRWWQGIWASLPSANPLPLNVFRLRYGNQVSSERCAVMLGVDISVVDSSSAGLRSALVQVASADGVELAGLRPESLDSLLRRYARYSPGPCPDLDEVIRGFAQHHVAACHRCALAHHLVTEQKALTMSNLICPRAGVRSREKVQVLALAVHPDAASYRDQVGREFGAASMPVDDDLMLIDAGDMQHVERNLHIIAEVGAPNREFLRGRVVTEAGRWSRHGLLGPFPAAARSRVQDVAWGTVVPFGELPTTAPTPPKGTGWWMLNTVLAVLLLLLVGAQLQEIETTAELPLEVSFVSARDGHWVSFDVDETAWVYVVSKENDSLWVVQVPQQASDKLIFAVGDGSYRFHVGGDGVLLASSPESIPGFEALVSDCGDLPELASRLQELNPSADVRVTDAL